MIALQAFFQQDANSDIGKVLACAGNVSDENVSNWGDDGVTQQVQTWAGIVQKVQVTVPNPVTLTPYRTFLEVAQPSSKFVLRMKPGNGAPVMALFEADGGNWKLESIDNISTWLQAELPKDVTILT